MRSRGSSRSIPLVEPNKAHLRGSKLPANQELKISSRSYLLGHIDVKPRVGECQHLCEWFPHREFDKARCSDLVYNGATRFTLTLSRGGTMAGTASKAAQQTSRRGFLKRVALLGAAASALGMLAKKPLARLGAGDRSVPAQIPGAGSIFQPRNDRRRQKNTR